MSKFRCVSSHPEDLHSGRSLAPGDTVELDANEQAEEVVQRLLNDGKLIPTGEQQEEKLTGDALDARATELDIEGRSSMTADELRAAVAEAEANDNKEEGDE